MAPPKTFRTKRLVTFNTELDRFIEFEDICHNERKSTTEKLNEFIVQTVETNGIGKDNPLGITYGPAVQQKITSFNAKNPIEALDQFIENKKIGLKDWEPAFAEITNPELIERYVNLTSIIHTAAKNRMSYLKTGKAVVTTGKVTTLPSMKGTRSGF